MEALRAAGCRVIELPEEPTLPDAVFVEDTAVVLDELAIITRPGASSRRAETQSVQVALKPFRSLFFIEPPATLDGGDVLRIGRRIYVGVSARTNRAGIDSLEAIASRFGYEVRPVEVHGCLHLKSAATWVGEDRLLVQRDWIEASSLADHELIDIDPSEPMAANGLFLESGLIYPLSFPRTAERLRKRGLELYEVDASELAKAEGGVTCCSLVWT